MIGKTTYTVGLDALDGRNIDCAFEIDAENLDQAVISLTGLFLNQKADHGVLIEKATGVVRCEMTMDSVRTWPKEPA